MIHIRCDSVLIEMPTRGTGWNWANLTVSLMMVNDVGNLP